MQTFVQHSDGCESHDQAEVGPGRVSCPHIEPERDMHPVEEGHMHNCFDVFAIAFGMGLVFKCSADVENTLHEQALTYPSRGATCMVVSTYNGMRTIHA